MNKQEARILEGIYRHNPTIGGSRTYPAVALLWLAEHSYRKGQSWRREDGTFQTLSADQGDWLSSHQATVKVVEQYLSYLHAMGFIQLGTPAGSSGEYSIAVTGQGAVRAREAATPLGRLNLLYKERKDGVIWLLATIAISMITTCVSARLSGRPRAEAVPRGPLPPGAQAH